MTVYDPYTDTFYDSSEKQDVITSDKTIIPVHSLKQLSIKFGCHYPGLEPPFDELCEDVIKGGII